jgi:hypothetical protein
MSFGRKNMIKWKEKKGKICKEKEENEMLRVNRR